MTCAVMIVLASWTECTCLMHSFGKCFIPRRRSGEGAFHVINISMLFFGWFQSVRCTRENKVHNVATRYEDLRRVSLDKWLNYWPCAQRVLFQGNSPFN